MDIETKERSLYMTVFVGPPHTLLDPRSPSGLYSTGMSFDLLVPGDPIKM